MHVLDRLERLVEELEGLDLAESLVLVQIIEQIPVLGVLQHDVDLFLLLEDLVELDDVGMLEPPVDEDLSPEVFPIHTRHFSTDINLKT